MKAQFSSIFPDFQGTRLVSVLSSFPNLYTFYLPDHSPIRTAAAS